MVDYLEELCRKGDASWVISRQVSRLRELWNDRQAEVCQDRMPVFIEGTLSEGWSLALASGGQAHLLTDAEIFGLERPQPRTRARLQAEAPENVYADLKPGDWVVHIDYGIGRFAGLVRRTPDGPIRTTMEFGEWNLMLYLLDGVNDGDATIAAGGWGGDVYRVHWNGSEIAFAYLFEGDAPRDGGELATALVQSLRANMAVGSTVTDDAAGSTLLEGDDFAFVQRVGARVLVILASDPGAGRALVGALQLESED